MNLSLNQKTKLADLFHDYTKAKQEATAIMHQAQVNCNYDLFLTALAASQEAQTAKNAINYILVNNTTLQPQQTAALITILSNAGNALTALCDTVNQHNQGVN